jgi:DNA recombination-dependent growth factor C
MGFGSRTVSLIRYRVRGEIDGPFWEAVEDGLKRGAFKEVDSAADIIGMGWTSLDDFTDFSFESASYARANYAAFALRVDTVRVPPRILEIHFKQESRKLLQQTGQRRLSAAQSREMKDRLKETLRKGVFPSIQVFDVIWNTSEGMLYFGTLSIKARERMEEHFKKSFGLSLIPLIPYLNAEEILEDKAEKRRLQELKPCSMAR